MVWIVEDALRIGPPSQRKEHDLSAAPDHRIRPRERQAAPTAHNSERSLIGRGNRPPAHVATSKPDVAPATAGIIGDRLPPWRIKSNIFRTTGSSEKATLVDCRRT